MTRVLHTMTATRVGSMASAVEALAGGRARSGAPTGVVMVCDGADDGIDISSRLIAAGAVVERLREWDRVAEFARRWKPDVVHAHGTVPELAEWTLVSTAHAVGDVRGLRRCRAVAAVSRPLKSELESRGVANVHFVPNAWNERVPVLDRTAALAELGQAENGERRIGWVGRFSREKGADLAIEAMAGIAGGVRLVLVGEGPEESRLRALVARLGLAARVDFAGVKPRAGRLMRAFDFVLLSARTAGTPLVLMEALAAGTPVIATRVGGVPDVVGERESFSCAPTVESLRRAMVRALADPVGARWRVEAGRSRVVGVGDWLNRHEALYESAHAA